jgi:hypothetical protein
MIVAGNGSISMLEINQGVQTEMSRNRQTRGSTRKEHSNNNASKHCLPRSEQLRTITEKRSELSCFSAVSQPFLSRFFILLCFAEDGSLGAATEYRFGEGACEVCFETIKIR